MLLSFILAACFAFLLWWLGTGVVLWLDGLPRKTFVWSILATSLVSAAGLYAIWWAQTESSQLAIYLAFAGGLSVWAWQEMSYYLGFLTGPRKKSCDPGCRGWVHFAHALQTSLYHEISIVVGAVLVWTLSRQAEIPIGFWTYVVLWAMHESARINVFLGVRNVNAEWLPEHLAYLRSFLRQAPMNPWFPLSVMLAALAAAWVFYLAWACGDPIQASAFYLLGALATLALVEHVFLMLPVPLTAPWAWALGKRRREPA